MLKQKLAFRCSRLRAPVLQRHSSGFPYRSIQAGPSDALREMLRISLPWEVLQAARGCVQMRAGLVTISAKEGRHSNTLFQACLFCGAKVGPTFVGAGSSATYDTCSRFAVVHCLEKCVYWAARRPAFILKASLSPTQGIGDYALAVLRNQPCKPGFAEAVLWVDQVSREAEDWWHRAEEGRS